MRNIPGWNLSNLIESKSKVYISGKLRRHASIQITRSLPRTFPGQSRRIGGITAATGTLVILPDGDFRERVETPWTATNTYPKLGSRVEIFIDHNGTEVRVFTGRVDRVKSGVTDPEIEVDVVDDFDRLNQQVTTSAVARMMPPLSTTGDERPRATGLLSTWVTDFAARGSGFYATPDMDGYCIISAPLQGSTWPERGNLRYSHRPSDVGNWSKYHPGASVSDSRVYMTQVFAEYEPDRFNLPYSGPITVERPLNITMVVGPRQASSSYVGVIYSSGWMLRVAVSGSRNISAQMVSPEGVAFTLAYISSGSAGSYQVVTARWRPSGTGSIEATLTTDTGASASGVNTAPRGSRTEMFTSARVYAPEGCYVAGAQVSFTGIVESAAQRFQRSFYHNPDSPMKNIFVVPAMNYKPAVELLKDQMDAEGGALWIDEDGNLQCWGPNRLTTKAVDTTLNSREHILDLSWSLDGQEAHRKVIVRYREPAVSIASRSRLVAYEGTKEELEPGDVQDLWISPSNDEEWIMTDSTARTVYGDFNAGKFNSGDGTFVGFTALKSNGDEIPILDGTDSSNQIDISFEKVGARSFHVITSVNSLSSPAHRITTQSRTEDGAATKKAYRGRGLPLLRCMGKATWSTQEIDDGITGPSWATDYEHEASWFVQTKEHGLLLARDIAESTKTPIPLFQEVPIKPDIRLMVGDRVRLQDPVRTGISLLGVVVGIKHNHTPDDHKMTIDLLVTVVQHAYVTLEDYDSFYRTMTLARVDEKFTQESLASKDSKPLRE